MDGINGKLHDLFFQSSIHEYETTSNVILILESVNVGQSEY